MRMLLLAALVFVAGCCTPTPPTPCPTPTVAPIATPTRTWAHAVFIDADGRLEFMENGITRGTMSAAFGRYVSVEFDAATGIAKAISRDGLVCWLNTIDAHNFHALAQLGSVSISCDGH